MFQNDNFPILACLTVFVCYDNKGNCQMTTRLLHLGCCSAKSKDIDEKQVLLFDLIGGGGGGSKVAL